MNVTTSADRPAQNAEPQGDPPDDPSEAPETRAGDATSNLVAEAPPWRPMGPDPFIRD